MREKETNRRLNNGHGNRNILDYVIISQTFAHINTSLNGIHPPYCNNAVKEKIQKREKENVKSHIGINLGSLTNYSTIHQFATYAYSCCICICF